MTLHFPLQVNGKYIGEFDAVRIWPDNLTDSDLMCRYKVTIYTVATEDKSADTWTGEVSHRVADGAWKLVLTALLHKTTAPIQPDDEFASAWMSGYNACAAGEQRPNSSKTGI